MLKWLMALMSNFFQAAERASRPIWEYRIRFMLEKNTWVIELKENDNIGWVPMSRRSDETEGELHVMRFDSYAKAKAEADRLGLEHAYQEARYMGMHRVLPGGEREPHALPSMAQALPSRGGIVRPIPAHGHH